MNASPTELRLRAAVSDATRRLEAALVLVDGNQSHPSVTGPLHDYAQAVSALTANGDAHDRDLIRAQLRLTPTERLDSIARRASAMRRFPTG